LNDSGPARAVHNPDADLISCCDVEDVDQMSSASTRQRDVTAGADLVRFQ
jgi:hypothetical protein